MTQLTSSPMLLATQPITDEEILLVHDTAYLATFKSFDNSCQETLVGAYPMLETHPCSKARMHDNPASCHAEVIPPQHSQGHAHTHLEFAREVFQQYLLE